MTATPTLRMGMRGSDVRLLQQKLGVPGDGHFGPITHGAVVAFQHEQGLLIDGIVGPRTWARLLALADPGPAQKTELAGDAFSQRLLSLLRLTGAWESARWAAVLAPRMLAVGLTTENRVSMFLSNVYKETGKLRVLEENLYYTEQRLTEVWPSRFPSVAAARPYARNPRALAIFVYGGRMGNDRQEDGWTFRGRGILQTTGRFNYTEFSKSTGIPLATLTSPTSPLLNPEGAADSAILFWNTSGCMPLADAGHSTALRQRINGGVNGLSTVLEYERTLRRAWASL